VKANLKTGRHQVSANGNAKEGYAMVHRKSVLAACSAAIVVLVMSASGDAWVASRTNHLTFTGPVALPGVTLARGTYTFELASPTNLDVVRVLSRDGSKLYFIGLTTPSQRPAGMPADRLVSIGEAPAGAPPPITAWYPLGHSMGHQFIYGREKNSSSR
jgi:hypothetical protein